MTLKRTKRAGDGGASRSSRKEPQGRVHGLGACLRHGMRGEEFPHQKRGRNFHRWLSNLRADCFPARPGTFAIQDRIQFDGRVLRARHVNFVSHLHCATPALAGGARERTKSSQRSGV